MSGGNGPRSWAARKEEEERAQVNKSGFLIWNLIGIYREMEFE